MLTPFMASSQFSSNFVQLELQQEQSLMSLIDTVYYPYTQRHTQDLEFKDKLTTIRTKLIQIINNNSFKDTTFFALEYLVHRLDATIQSIQIPQIITTISTVVQTIPQQVTIPTTTTTPPTVEPITPINNVQIASVAPTPSIDTSSYYKWDKNILAWTTSHPLFKYEIIAKLEWAMIEDMSFVSSIQDLERAVDKVLIFDENWVLLWESRPQNNRVTFNNIDRKIDKGQTDLYVLLSTKAIWYNSSAPQSTTFWFNFAIDNAYGLVSGNTLPVTAHSTSETVTIVPTLVTDVRLTDQRNNRIADTRLFAGENDLAILVLWSQVWQNTTTDSWRTLNTYLERVSFLVQDNTTLWNVAYNMFLTPLDGWDSIQWNFQNWSEVVFDLSGLWNDALISDSEESAFMISAEIPNLDPINQESVSIQLVSTDSWWIAYKTSDPTSLTITDLNLRTKPTNRITSID